MEYLITDHRRRVLVAVAAAVPAAFVLSAFSFWNPAWISLDPVPTVTLAERVDFLCRRGPWITYAWLPPDSPSWALLHRAKVLTTPRSGIKLMTRAVFET